MSSEIEQGIECVTSLVAQIAEMVEAARSERWPDGREMLRHLAATGREDDALRRIDYIAAKAEMVIFLLKGEHVGLRDARAN